MLKQMLAIAGLVSLAFAGQQAAAQDTVLRYNFTKDEPLIYRTTMEMNQTTQVNGQSFENKTTQTEVNTLSLVEVTKDKDLKVRHINKSLSVKSDLGPAGTYRFDSDSVEREKGTALSNQLNPVFETLSGVEFDITLSPAGKIEKLHGYKEIIETLVKDHPLAAQITGGGSEDAMKNGLAEIFFEFQDEPVGVGDTWEVPFETELPKIGKAKGKRIYKYEGPITEDNPTKVRLTMSMEMSFDIDLMSEGARITGNIATDSSEGDIRFDTELGQVTSATLNYTLSGTMNVRVAEQDIKITIKQSQKRSTQKLTELPK